MASLPLGWIFAAVIAALLILALGPIGSPGGLGIHDQTSTKVERDKNWKITKYSIEKIEGKTAWDWLGLIGVPTTLAFLGIWFQRQEQKRASRDAEEQRRLASEENKEETLQRYLDRVSQLIIEKDLINASRRENNSIADTASDVIRARTLSVLRSFRLDRDRKASVIFFLIETEVLHSLKVSLDGANLREADLSGADLSGAYLRGADLSEAKLISVNLSRANLSGAKLISVNLSRAKLFGANLSRANLSRASLSMAKLISVNLRGASLSMADLSGADLSEADISMAKLSGAKLISVNLSRANLSRAYLSGAYLGGASLSEAELIWANLSGANLSMANLREADLSGADLSGAYLGGADVEGIKWDEKTTKWPDRSCFSGARNIPESLQKQLGL